MNTNRFFYVLGGAAVILAIVLIGLGIRSPQVTASQPALQAAVPIPQNELVRSQRSRAAEAARWDALAASSVSRNAAAPQSNVSNALSIQAAESARWEAMARFYNTEAGLARPFC